MGREWFSGGSRGEEVWESKRADIADRKEAWTQRDHEQSYISRTVRQYIEIKITDTIADKRNDMKENDEWKDSDVHDWTTSEYGSSMIKQSRDMIDNDESIERHATREIQI